MNSETIHRLTSARERVRAGMYLHVKSGALYMTHGPSIDQSNPDGPCLVFYWPVVENSDTLNQHHRTIDDFTAMVELANGMRTPRFLSVCSPLTIPLLTQALTGPVPLAVFRKALAL